MKNLKRFFKYLKPYRRFQFLSILYNVLYALFSSISMLSLLPMVNILFGEERKQLQKPNALGYDNFSLNAMEDHLDYWLSHLRDTNGPIMALVVVVGFVLFTFFLKNLFGYLSILYMTYLNNGILKDLRQDVYDKIINLNVGFFSNERKGDIIARMTTELNTIRVSFMSVLMMVREPLTIVFTLLGMFMISWKLTLFVILFIPLSGFLISKVSKNIKSQSGDIFAMEGNLLSNIEETLGGIKIIKNFTSESFFSKKFVDLSENINDLNNSIGKKMGLSAPASEFLGILAISMLLIYGGSLVLVDKSLSGGAFIAYLGLAYQILTPAKAITKANHALQGGNAAFDRVAFILDAVNPLEDKPNAHIIKEFKNEIRFNNVSFKYKDDFVLQDFNLVVPKGKIIALVGESGSGKSTIANLITRFYDVQQGAITFDGLDIREVTGKSLRAQMGIVSQDSILFNDTVANNISLGIETANENNIVAAAKIANAHNFICELPNQYQQNIGDGGCLLSGGQRQRLAIARAVMKNPPIMILDEATSALDSESEKLVQDALDNMMENRTAIVIAHRLSTIQKADLIIVMKKGRIIEQGTHEELLKRDSTYRMLVSLQSLEAV